VVAVAGEKHDSASRIGLSEVMATPLAPRAPVCCFVFYQTAFPSLWQSFFFVSLLFLVCDAMPETMERTRTEREKRPKTKKILELTRVIHGRTHHTTNNK
jgi:hypothetical protein